MNTITLISIATAAAIVARTEEPLSRIFGVLIIATIVLLSATEDAKKARRKRQKAHEQKARYRDAV